MDPVDTVFAQRLRQAISDILNGTEGQNGWYHTASHGAPSWETYQRIVGRIEGLELALKLTNETLQQLANPDAEQSRRAGLN